MLLATRSSWGQLSRELRRAGTILSWPTLRKIVVMSSLSEGRSKFEVLKKMSFILAWRNRLVQLNSDFFSLLWLNLFMWWTWQLEMVYCYPRKHPWKGILLETYFLKNNEATTSSFEATSWYEKNTCRTQRNKQSATHWPFWRLEMFEKNEQNCPRKHHQKPCF